MNVMNVTVNVTNFEIFEELLEISKSFISDERIPTNLKDEYFLKLKGVIEKYDQNRGCDSIK